MGSASKWSEKHISFSCPGSSIPDLGQWLTDWLGATLEFWHKEWLLRLETLWTFDRGDELRKNIEKNWNFFQLLFKTFFQLKKKDFLLFYHFFKLFFNFSSIFFQLFFNFFQLFFNFFQFFSTFFNFFFIWKKFQPYSILVFPKLVFTFKIFFKTIKSVMSGQFRTLAMFSSYNGKTTPNITTYEEEKL